MKNIVQFPITQEKKKKPEEELMKNVHELDSNGDNNYFHLFHTWTWFHFE